MYEVQQVKVKHKNMIKGNIPDLYVRYKYDYYRVLDQTAQSNTDFRRVWPYEYKSSTTNSTWIQ